MIAIYWRFELRNLPEDFYG